MRLSLGFIPLAVAVALVWSSRTLTLASPAPTILSLGALAMVVGAVAVMVGVAPFDRAEEVAGATLGGALVVAVVAYVADGASGWI